MLAIGEKIFTIKNVLFTISQILQSERSEARKFFYKSIKRNKYHLNYAEFQSD